jgi:NCAIR mutase (PurE)-related protein
VTEAQLEQLLERFKGDKVTKSQVLKQLKAAPFESLKHTLVDHHRAIRKGFPEVIFAEGKEPVQVKEIVGSILARSKRVLVTRASKKHALAVKKAFPKAKYHSSARCIVVTKGTFPIADGKILVVCAGTSDLPVADEAAVTCEAMGNRVERINDVGVAGLHRLLAHLDQLLDAKVVIAVAGMEGALPSAIAGLVAAPVIAVPTSVGYGASFSGVSALLGMLNSCGSGVTVVNIDNGFGAGYAAAQINAISNKACLDPSE